MPAITSFPDVCTNCLTAANTGRAKPVRTNNSLVFSRNLSSLMMYSSLLGASLTRQIHNLFSFNTIEKVLVTDLSPVGFAHKHLVLEIAGHMNAAEKGVTTREDFLQNLVNVTNVRLKIINRTTSMSMLR